MKTKTDPTSIVVNVRIPFALLQLVDGDIARLEMQRTGYPQSRSAIVVRAIEDFARKTLSVTSPDSKHRGTNG